MVGVEPTPGDCRSKFRSVLSVPLNFILFIQKIYTFWALALTVGSTQDNPLWIIQVTVAPIDIRPQRIDLLTRERK
ncbi:hypothetical protein HGRIS_008954 [Hohenbuehelia grisea]|uniref:Uncharacterized protein n=1 Tax=Hohenbuehelia grisea TaxID=104357 RepID=A0ABR3IZP3_9AGAR